VTVDLAQGEVPSRSENALCSAGSRHSRHPFPCAWSSVALQGAGSTAGKARTSDCKPAAPKSTIIEDGYDFISPRKVIS
jgi:hypothetical protein